MTRPWLQLNPSRPMHHRRVSPRCPRIAVSSQEPPPSATCEHEVERVLNLRAMPRNALVMRRSGVRFPKAAPRESPAPRGFASGPGWDSVPMRPCGGSDAPVVPPIGPGGLPPGWHPAGARTGPSSSRRWRAPAPAADPRQRPAAVMPRCGAGRERAPAHRLPPWRPASRATASSSTPAAAPRLAQRNSQGLRLFPRGPPIDDRH
jgi:hypothetical protein